MKNSLLALAAAALLAGISQAEEPAVPFEDPEVLKYAVSYPSGLSLGEGELSARRETGSGDDAGNWAFEFRLKAAVPGFEAEDQYRSVATPELCSLEFHKRSAHGKRVVNEKTTFDQDAKRAVRNTLDGGGSSEIPAPACAMDGLTFLYHLRRELSRGRIPPPQTVLFGASYKVRLQHAGSARVVAGSEVYEVDRLTATVTGPASESTFLVEISQDEARTPVRVTLPLEPGSFTLELVP